LSARIFSHRIILTARRTARKAETERVPATFIPPTPAGAAEVGNIDLTALSTEEFARIETASHRHFFAASTLAIKSALPR